MWSRKCWIVSFFFTFFCTFPIGNFLSEGRFWTTTLPHHTPPPIPKLSSITKTRILFVFLPKKVPVFCLYFYKNEPVWRIRHTALSDFSLNPSIRQLLIDVAASHKSSPIFWWEPAVSAANHTIVATFKCRSVSERSCELGPLAPPDLMHSCSLEHYYILRN